MHTFAYFYFINNIFIYFAGLSSIAVALTSRQRHHFLNDQDTQNGFASKTKTENKISKMTL
jgi:hypothetical protein